MNQNEHYPITINLGCGEQGAKWLNTNNSSKFIFGIDHRKLDSQNTNYSIAEAINLPIQDASVKYLFADFYFNPMGNEAISDFSNNPDIFMEDKYPSQLKDWYINNMHENRELAVQNLKQVRDIVRSMALTEALRVLAPKGVFTIIDHLHVSNWIEEQLKDNKTLNIKEEPLLITDLGRSASLNKLLDQGVSIKKLKIIKNS